MPRTQNIAAAGLAMAASAILSFIDNFVGAVSQEAGLWQFQLFRTLFAIPLLLMAARVSGMTLWPGEAFITAPWAAPSARFLWLTLVQAVGAVVAVSLIAQAYRIGTSATVAVFEYSSLIFASLWAFLLWGTATNTLAVIGIIVIFVSGVLMATISNMKSDDAASI